MFVRATLLLPVLLSVATTAEKPNVVFILADDLGINDLACYGRAEHVTPTLDRLAADGLRFTNAYAACPVCSPTRAAIMTGLHPARLHLTTYLPGRADAKSQKLLQPKIAPQLPPAQTTLAERLKAAGYATACIGKWHLGGNPKEQGFDVVHAGTANTTPGSQEGGKGEYDLANKAIEFLDANKDKPFFLYVAHNCPHIPLAAKRELVERYSHTFNPVYAAAVNTLDDSIGLLLAKIDMLKLRNNTIVVFTSDNGGLHVPEGKDDAPTHNSPHRAGKGFLYEGGLRVPLIVRYPGTVDPGKECAVPLISTDWTPTLLSLCGIASKDTFDGHDMSTVLKGGTGPDRALYWHVPHYTNQGSRPGGAIRVGDLKLIEHYEDGTIELFNLGADPRESRNQAGTLVGAAEAFKLQLAEWRETVKAQVNTPNPGFDAAKHKPIYLDTDVSKLEAGKTAKGTSDPLRDWRKLINEAVKK